MDLVAFDFAIDLEPLFERFGEGGVAALGGLLIGGFYGASAQRSRFCLRAATVEFARGRMGPRVSVWLLCFSTAVFWTQLFSAGGAISLAEARWLAIGGSISGALIGGLIFGAGMVLARGCPGRLLVLAGGGNLRSLLAGLVFAVTAQMSLRGAIAPVRDGLAGLWSTGGSNPQILDAVGFGSILGLPTGVLLGIVAAAVALAVALKNGVSTQTLFAGSGVGFAVALGWWFTYQLSIQSFEPVGVESLTFSGPSADTLMFVLTPFDGAWDFDIGLVPGVLLGAALAAALTGDWRWEGYDGAAAMRRSLLGAACMGFGAMLAGGCAIGAGVTGASTFALTAWVALSAFWAGAAATDWLVDRGGAAQTQAVALNPGE